MNTYTSVIISTRFITHNTWEMIASKPAGFTFEAGQACMIRFQEKGQLSKARPFSVASAPQQAHLSFIIKQEHKDKSQLPPNGSLIEISEAFGSIRYRGPGVFIAGGTGLSPFLSIFRHLKLNGQQENQTLLYASRTREDILIPDELNQLLGNRLTHVLSREARPETTAAHDSGYVFGHIDKALLQKQLHDFSKQAFYLCGPPDMVSSLTRELESLGVSPGQIVREIWN